MFWGKERGTWIPWTWSNLIRDSHSYAAGHFEMGLKPGDRAAIFTGNRPEWFIADFGIQSAGGVSVPVYMHSNLEHIEFVLGHSEARTVLVDTEERLESLLEVEPKLPKLERIIATEQVTIPDHPKVCHLSSFLEEGNSPKQHEEVVESIRGLDPNVTCTISYTSGTTGIPKGVMLNPSNFMFVLENSEKNKDFISGDNEVTMSYLPLAHIAQRLGDYTSLYHGAQIYCIDDVYTFADELPQIRPTLFVAVPRILEKLYEKIHDAVRKANPRRQKIFAWAERQAHANYTRFKAGKKATPGEWVQWKLADTLVFRKIRNAIGGRVQAIVVGGSPLPPRIGSFFYGAGMPVFEVYGLTETTAPISHPSPDDIRYGTVGKVIEGGELKLGDDNEVLFRGPNVFQGYFRRPEATSEVLTKDGWFHTGDLGSMDNEGNLLITGRKKDLIITAGGKNIAPAPIEEKLRRHHLVSQAVVIGDNQKYLVALLTLDSEILEDELKSRGLQAEDMTLLAEDTGIMETLEAHVSKVNESLARVETLKGYKILRREFSPETGELTLSMKIRRNVVYENHDHAIRELYGNDFLVV
jgi:long-chain acyl-CoA synthetase